MILSKNRHKRLALTALAAALSLGLAACDRQQSPDKTGQSMGQPGQQQEQTAGNMQKQIDQANAALSEKATAAGKAVDDAALTARVKAALIAEPSIKAMAIDVDSKDGVVTLFGTVDSLAVRDKATQTVAGVEGVKSVLNNLKIISGS
jgi:hyperosmotically inducible periplasmic protein